MAALPTPLKRAALFGVILLFPGLPAIFGVTLVLSSLGLGTFAPHLAAALIGGLLGYRWVGTLGGERKREALAEATAAAALVGLGVAVVVIAAAGTGAAASALLAAVALVAGVAGAGFVALRRAQAGLGSEMGAAAAPRPDGKGDDVSDGALVGIVMGSNSDMDVMKDCEAQLTSLGVPFETVVASAHRQPSKVHEWAGSAEARGLRVIVAAAGKAAHLGGVVAAYTTLPVICVPMKTSDLGGLDSLLSMVQMPTGVPVACVAINGARNAAILATQILGTSMPEYRDAVAALKTQMAEG